MRARMLDRVRHGLSARAAGDDFRRRRSIAPFALSLAYPGGRADIWIARVDAAAPDLGPARAALARRLAAWRAGVGEDAVSITHDERGAPRLRAPGAAFSVSLAGRDDLVAAAVADGPVGVDIEPAGAAFDPPLNVLHPGERAALAAAGRDSHDDFLRLWVAKEAYVKALGAGLTREPTEIEIRPPASFSFAHSPDLAIFDLGRPVATALARAGRLALEGRRVLVACVVLAR